MSQITFYLVKTNSAPKSTLKSRGKTGKPENTREGAIKYKIANDTNCAEVSDGQQQNLQWSNFNNCAVTSHAEGPLVYSTDQMKRKVSGIMNKIIFRNTTVEETWRESVSILQIIINGLIEALTTKSNPAV